MTEELWRPIPNLELLYEVSDLGRVRRLFERAGTGRQRLARAILLTPKRGVYLSVTLARDGWKKRFYIHDLVLRAFVGPPPPKHEGAHENGKHHDNRLANLSWKTRKANHADKRRHGTLPLGAAHHNAKLTERAVREIRASEEFHRVLAARYGVSRSLISMVKRGELWRDANAA